MLDKSVRPVEPPFRKMKSGKMAAKSPAAEELNDFMEALEAKVYSIHKKFIRLEKPLTLHEFEHKDHAYTGYTFDYKKEIGRQNWMLHYQLWSLGAVRDSDN